MNLKIRDGQLALGSVFKLVAISWACFGLVLVGGLVLLLFAIGVGSGEMVVNGEVVAGRSQVLAAMGPMIVIVPIVVAIQSVLFAGFVTAGAALYRLRRPLTVTAETTTPTAL